MYILSISGWFITLIREFFFSIDRLIFNFIPLIYDLLIEIARTSVLTQSDILDMADRIYKLLAIFMIFKVTFSLIMYVVNPEDFSDKSKGIAKLGTNIIISLSLLILTPYLFSYAYNLQTIILEDNALAALVFGDDRAENKFLNTAGDDMAFMAMRPFFTPDTSVFGACTDLNDECYEELEEETDEDESFTPMMLGNYKAGIKASNLGLMFRMDLATATVEKTIDGDDEDVYVMDYKFIFSTAVGVILILLLITFCMDVAVRSIKLAFLQLIAPIPILSYVDPKSGKDGMFKKWYQMCFKTFLSLFIRLLALYFAVYIISRVADMTMVDIIDGSRQTNWLVCIFIMIGALMFAKQFTKILEGLGVKLDGDGKFFLNPLKKFEDQAIGGKRITGAARGFLTGAAGMATGAGLGRAISGAWRGATSGKGWKETGKMEADMNKKMRQAKMNGASFGGRMKAKFDNALGLPSASEKIDREKYQLEKRQKSYDDRIKSIQDGMKPTKTKISERKKFSDSIKAMEDRAKGEIENGNSWIGKEYKLRKKNEEFIENNIGKTVTRKFEQRDIDYAKYRIDKAQKEIDSANRTGDAAALSRAQAAKAEAERRLALAQDSVNNNKTFDINISADDAAWESSMATDWISDIGMKRYMTDATSGVIDDATFTGMRDTAEIAASEVGETLSRDGATIHKQYGTTKAETRRLEDGLAIFEKEIRELEDKKADLGDDLREISKREQKAKANESTIQ